MDRFYRGFTAGVIAGIPMNTWNLGSYYLLGQTDTRFLDWAGVFLYGAVPQTFLTAVIAQIMQLFWVGFLGIVFAYLIPQTTSRGYLGKAVIYSIVVGFFQYAIPVLYKVPPLATTSTATVMSNQIGGIIWGLTLGYAARRLDNTRLEEGR